MHQSAATELQRLRPSAPAWLWLSVLASALRFQRWGTYDLPHVYSPQTHPRLTKPHGIASLHNPIADLARVPQPPPPQQQQQYGYNAPPQGQYGRPSEQLLPARASWKPAPSGTYSPLLTECLTRRRTAPELELRPCSSPATSHPTALRHRRPHQLCIPVLAVQRPPEGPARRHQLLRPARPAERLYQ